MLATAGAGTAATAAMRGRPGERKPKRLEPLSESSPQSAALAGRSFEGPDSGGHGRSPCNGAWPIPHNRRWCWLLRGGGQRPAFRAREAPLAGQKEVLFFFLAPPNTRGVSFLGVVYRLTSSCCGMWFEVESFLMTWHLLKSQCSTSHALLQYLSLRVKTSSSARALSLSLLSEAQASSAAVTT